MIQIANSPGSLTWDWDHMSFGDVLGHLRRISLINYNSWENIGRIRRVWPGIADWDVGLVWRDLRTSLRVRRRFDRV